MKREIKKSNQPEPIFPENKRLLEKRYPELWTQIQSAVGDNRNIGIATVFSKETRALISREEQSRPAIRKWVAEWHYEPYDTLFLIGMGLGFLPVEATSRNIGNPRLIIIEPSLEMFCSAMATNDLETVLTDTRIDLFVGDHISVSDIVSRMSDIIPIGSNRIIVNPSYENILGDKIRPIKMALTEKIRAVRDNWFTTKKFGQRMADNAFANLPSLFAGTPMKNLNGRFNGVPAICVAAGPSLDHAIPDLIEIQDYALIIACDSSVNALVKNGISPHIVVTTDIFETNIDKLKPHLEALKDTILIYSIESNPDNVRLFLSTRRVAVSAYNKLLLLFLDPALRLGSQFPAMSSVTHMALFTALALGCNPIVMVGMDLAYLDGKSHSFDSAFFHSLDEKKLVPTYGNRGTLIESSPQLVADKLLIENTVAQHPQRFINTSVNGVYIEGTELRRLAEVITELTSISNRTVNTVIEEIVWEPSAVDADVAIIIDELTGEFDLFKRACQQKKIEIEARIDQLNDHSPTEQVKEELEFLRCEFKQFQKKYNRHAKMIMEIMLADFQDIAQQEEVLAADSQQPQRLLVPEALHLLKKKYTVYEDGIKQIIDNLNVFRKQAGTVAELKQNKCSDKESDNYSELASHYRTIGELWQVKREYERWIENQHDTLTPYLELAQAYAQEGLWKSAKAVLKKANSCFKNESGIDQFDIEVEKGVDGIFDGIKNAWMKGDIHTARRLLIPYLSLRPNDPQGNELKKVIRKLDEEFSGDRKKSVKPASAKPGDRVRFQKAVQLIKNRQVEKGIGILEGIYEDVPESRSSIREQIGDIRAMQKNVRSALWNYEQALRLAPERNQLKEKMMRYGSLLKV